MIKKITLIFLVFCMMISCGRKGAPEYKDSEKETKIEIIPISKIS
tara:strand:+ start:217 stop:351 length:135 start_codon:yes stop_codon:yes gene_type:complete